MREDRARFQPSGILNPMSALNIAIVPPCGTVIPADCDSRIAAVLRYWQHKHPKFGAVPGRQHVHPAALPDLLRPLWLCDVQREPLRFRYRLVGTSIVHVTGKEITGEWLDEVHENFTASPAYADFAAAAEAGVCIYYKGRALFHLNKDYVWMERLLMPLARDGHTVDMLLGITGYCAPGAAN